MRRFLIASTLGLGLIATGCPKDKGTKDDLPDGSTSTTSSTSSTTSTTITDETTKEQVGCLIAHFVPGQTGGEPQLWVTTSDGQSTTQVSTLAEAGRRIAFSPDGARLAWENQTQVEPYSAIGVTDVTDDPTEHWMDQLEGPDGPIWSSDSSKVVVGGVYWTPGGAGDLHVWTPGGALVDLTTTYEGERPLDVSPVDDNVLHTIDGILHTMPITGGSSLELYAGGTTSKARFSPDGSQIAALVYPSQTQELVVMNANGTGAATWDMESFSRLVWSPDGATVLAWGSDAIHLYSNGGADHVVIPVPGVDHADFGPGGNTLLYLDGSGLVEADLDGSSPVVLVATAVEEFAVSPLCHLL